MSLPDTTQLIDPELEQDKYVKAGGATELLQ